MGQIQLTPTGHLLWQPGEQPEPAALAPVRAAFERDWRAGWFALGASRAEVGDRPDLRYWQRIAERYLTALCHVPGSNTQISIDPPGEADIAQWVLTAPPMQGAEYLRPEVLEGLWQQLDQWVGEAVAAAGGLEAFLTERAPRWNQVGRVCFHLAENKYDAQRPFAFLATYSTGFGAGGRVKHLPLGKALEQYAGAKNKPALIKLLTPVQRAAEACDWLAPLVDSGDIFHPLTWTPREAHTFLRSVESLEEAGLSVRVPDWWHKRLRPRVAASVGQSRRPVLGAEAVLDFNIHVALGSDTLSREEIEQLLAGPDGLVMLKGQWVEVDREKLQQALEHWRKVEAEAAEGGISFIEGMRLLSGASADLKHEDDLEQVRQWSEVTAGDAMQRILTDLRNPARLNGEAADPDADLKATLRPYQRQGVGWLDLLSSLGLGACLADDMGLGKTLQVLTLLLRLKRRDAAGNGCAGHSAKTGNGGGADRDGDGEAAAGQLSLLIVPASLLNNWRREAARFTPSLRLLLVHPSEMGREAMAQLARSPGKGLAGIDLVVTTYAMLARQPWLAGQAWRLVILDEAQAIKNPTTRQSRAVKKLKAHARIALTGTPVENRLGDLWALFDFLNPGLLGSASVFKSFIKQLEARRSDQFAPLRRLVSPYLLRRLKTDRSIIADLPEKTETAQYCTLTRPQVRLYERAVRQMQEALKEVGGMARRGLVLQTLLRLKQICNHPSQLAGDGEYKPADSGKFLRLSEICQELAQRQQKVLIFTQFREIIDPLNQYLADVFGRAGLTLHGATAVKQRRGIVERFQRDDGPPYLILSLKAGGTGLNLTAASHVIHFDRWWNPAVENQATDRAFRIGQKRNVLVHKFVTSGTIEQRIDAMIEDKRHLAEQLLADTGEVNLTEMPDEQLIELVRLDVTHATMQE